MMVHQWFVQVKCKFCGRVHCEAAPGSLVKFRCRKCKKIQEVTVGQ